MLLCHDVRVVHSLHTGLNEEIVTDVHARVHILNADLVVAAVESCEVVSQHLLVAQGLQLLATGVSHCQHQLGGLRLHLNDSYSNSRLIKLKLKLTLNSLSDIL